MLCNSTDRRETYRAQLPAQSLSCVGGIIETNFRDK